MKKLQDLVYVLDMNLERLVEDEHIVEVAKERLESYPGEHEVKHPLEASCGVPKSEWHQPASKSARMRHEWVLIAILFHNGEMKIAENSPSCRQAP